VTTKRILELAKQARKYSEEYARQSRYYRGVEDGLTWEGKINQVYDIKFAELILEGKLK
jgi:hypothetical protein